MKNLHLYYRIKPLIPRRLQISLRRAITTRKRKAYSDTWPIDPKAAKIPKDWRGWPDQKKFALVLSHDVETAKGQDKCRQLMALEERLGFRSSFNFVPEDYPVSENLRSSLVQAGFEVGLHGLKHDGKLFRSRNFYETCVPRINNYLNAWGAVGFRAPAMHHNLEWLSDLDVEYDSSTFDTDPFEPHSDGVGSIFPLWFTVKSRMRGYIELPYTLPQDHCLFVILKEKDNRIWEKKLAWIAQKGGMAFLNTHPDYMNFDGTRPALEEYPAKHYTAFLEFIKSAYEGQYWPALPRDMARFWRTARPESDRIEV